MYCGVNYGRYFIVHIYSDFYHIHIYAIGSFTNEYGKKKERKSILSYLINLANL